MRHDESSNRPPVIVLGGDFNALSVARSLAHAGIKVYALNYRHDRVCYSRFCQRIRLEGSDCGPATWEAFLLGPESDYLRGAVILTCSDEAIEIIINNDEQLKDKFVLEEIETEVRLCLLDKLSTYQKAQEIGVPVPRYWHVQSLTELKMLESELEFPILLKPRFSHKFKKVWHRYKYFRAENITDACDYFAQTSEQKIDVLIMEFIPGDDTKACSYYVYMDENNAPLVELTKRGLRRYPANMGRETFGFTDWNPEVRDLGARFFQHVGLRGPANIEFKLDERDGKLKLIEANARFTAPNCLVYESGIDLALLAYNRLTGRPQTAVVRDKDYKKGLRWWIPVDDFRAFLVLKHSGKITTQQWLSQVLRSQVLPAFRWDDPLPSLIHDARRAWRFMKSKLRR